MADPSTTGVTCAPGPHALQTVDDHRLAGLETAAHDAQAVRRSGPSVTVRYWISFFGPTT